MLYNDKYIRRYTWQYSQKNQTPQENTMAIIYIYYTNNPQYVNAYFWEPKKQSIKYNLQPYKGSRDIFACDDMLINFPKQTCTIRRNNTTYTAQLREPTKEYKNLKHQAHFDFSCDNWDDFLEAY